MKGKRGSILLDIPRSYRYRIIYPFEGFAVYRPRRDRTLRLYTVTAAIPDRLYKLSSNEFSLNRVIGKKYRPMRLNGFIFLTILPLSGCKKDVKTTNQNVKGTLTGAPGCSAWIIRDNYGIFWQPLNLNSFQVNLKSGQPVVFSFAITNLATTCMTGKTIELTSIQDQ